MKSILCKSLISISLLFSATSVFAMGQAAKVFESSTPAGIWDHGDSFYLRLDLAELADLKNQTFVWAGFAFDGKEFTGEVVANQFDKNERRFPARATVLRSTEEARWFLIEVLGANKEVIKEIVVKGPGSNLPTM